MIKKINLISLLFSLTPLFLSAQQINFTGKFEPGSLVIAEGNDIEQAYLNDTELQVDGSKIFVFGFDRNDSGKQLLKIKFADGKVSLIKIKLPEREYKVQKINNMKPELIKAPAELDERIKKEREISSEARSRIGVIDRALFKSGFQRPVVNGRVSGVFGSQRILNGKPGNIHNGLDIAAPTGTPVYAMAEGVVQLAADTFYYSGNNVLLDHGQGLNSFYLHLSKMDVQTGDTVKKGQKIGEIGTTGRSTGPHLHWGVQWYNRRVDPAELIKPEFKLFAGKSESEKK